MNKFLILYMILILLSACKTISKKVDDATQQEEKKLSKFLKKTESELKTD